MVPMGKPKLFGGNIPTCCDEQARIDKMNEKRGTSPSNKSTSLTSSAVRPVTMVPLTDLSSCVKSR